MVMQPTNNSAPTYYVSLDGSSSNLGTRDQPFRTIQQAVNQIADGGGGTIYVRGGTYTLDETVWIGNEHDGSANSRLVVRPYENEKVILEGNKDTVALAVGGQYIDIAGFEVRNSAQGIIGVGARDVRVLNNIVHDTDANGIAMYGSSIGDTSDIVIDGNTVYHTNLNNRERDPNRPGWGNAVFISRGRNAVITNNHVYENYGEGIIASLSDNVRAAYNTVHDNYSVEMYLDHATNTTFENNLIYSTGNSEYFRQLNGNWKAASGIEMNNEGYADSNPNNNNVVRNNVVIGGRYGLSVIGQVKNTQIVNNSFYGATERLVVILAAQNENVTISNNIFHQLGEVPIGYAVDGLRGVSFSSNLWFGGEAGQFAGLGDINGDPKFVNPGGLRAEDYWLQSNSPAIDAGRVVNVSEDYFGTVRSATEGYDIGAYEFKEITPAPTPNPTPTPTPAPTNHLIQGTNRDDRLTGTAGNDTILGLAGNDVLIGGAGNDTLSGSAGNDALIGGAGNDVLTGGAGNDTLSGLAGNDALVGGAGDDILNGGIGNNTFLGGLGSDQFLLTRGDGRVIIRDFGDSQDLLGLPAGMRASQLSMTPNGRNTEISFGADLLAIVNGVSPSQITATDFVTISMNS